MGRFRQFLAVEAAALVSLLIVAGGMAVYGAVDSSMHANSLLDPASSAQLGFGYTAVFGLVPVLLLGAPAYFILLRQGIARWYYAFLLGVLPGCLALAFDPFLGIWSMICGSTVALLTHFMCRRLGPNNSFKPNPLRGSA